MQFIEQALLRAGIITPGGYIDDAALTRAACVYNRDGVVTHRVHYACNGVDVVATNVRTGRDELRISLPLAA